MPNNFNRSLLIKSAIVRFRYNNCQKPLNSANGFLGLKFDVISIRKPVEQKTQKERCIPPSSEMVWNRKLVV